MSGVGPPIGATCTVCQHPDVLVVDNDVRGGVARRVIARRYGLGRNAVNSHARNHLNLPTPGSVAAPGVRVARGATTADTLRAAVEMYQKKLAAGTLRTDEAREMRLALGALDELEGRLAPPHAERATDLAGFAELEADMMLALEPFPEARMALARVMRAHMGVTQ